MFELIDFVNPTTKPKIFPVKTLSTQYRSMKDIGDLFSHYAYSGQVDSMKKISERNPLHFIKEDFKAFTLIRFPVSKSERLQRYLHRDLQGICWGFRSFSSFLEDTNFKELYL